MISSPVKGLMPLRAARAGFMTRRSFTATEGTVNSPEPFLFRWQRASEVRESSTAPTCFFVSPVSSAMALRICDLVCFVVMTVGFLAI
ncbi:hypothetical protein D3C83_45770 [compost metagenome]